MNKHCVAFMAIAVVAATATGGCHEAPRLVEYFPSVEHVPSADAASAPSVVATLDAIHDDPSAVDVQVGMAFPDAVRSARALSLELPDSNDAGLEVIASFGNLEIEQRATRLQRVRAERVAGIGDLAGGHGRDVVGTITYKRGLRGAPLGDGLTAVYRRDTSQWPEDTECGVTSAPVAARTATRIATMTA